jgi:phage tail-like protein
MDPYRGYLFTVSITGLQVAGFSEVTVPDITIDTVDYREGDDPPYKRVLSGLVTYGRVTLQRGLTNVTDLYDWHNTIVTKGASLPGARKNVTIQLNNGSQDNPGASWTLFNAWPISYKTGALNAASSEVVIETLEMAVETITRSKASS